MGDEISDIVAKHNDLILARNKLSETAQKLFVSAVSMVRPDDEEFHEYALKMSDYIKATGTKSKNIKSMEESIVKAADEIIGKSVWFGKSGYPLCIKADVGKREGYVLLQIHPDLKPYLLELQNRGNFTSYYKANFITLSGRYTPRIYEYLVMQLSKFKDSYQKKYNKMPQKASFEITISEFRITFAIPNSYNIGMLKVRVLEKAKKEIKQKTDIYFEYKEVKKNRKTEKLIFTIHDKTSEKEYFLETEKAFISYMRNNFINKDILYAPDKDTNKNLQISISPQGHIYDKTGVEINSARSKKIWNVLYSLAKEDKLDCLKKSTKIEQKKLIDITDNKYEKYINKLFFYQAKELIIKLITPFKDETLKIEFKDNDTILQVKNEEELIKYLVN